MLHAPDFLGYASGIEMAKDHPAIVERGLQLKKVGNDIIALLGGRSVHPINVRLGGFFKAPTKATLAPLAERLRWARDAALETVHWAATLPIPDFERDYEFVALSHPDEYPFNEGRLVSNRGLDIAPREYDDPRPRCLPCRPARALQPQFRPAVADRPRRSAPRGAGPGLSESVSEHR